MNKRNENGAASIQAEPMTIVVINRWDDDFALYGDYIDHDVHRVIYIATAAGRAAVPEAQAAAVYELAPSYTKEDLLVCCRQAEAAFGRIDRIIALSEYDLPKAAYLRETLDIPGVPSAQVATFTDKVAMKHAIAQAGLRAPDYIECNSIDAVIAFADRKRYPLILKPKVGAASRGIHAALSRTALLQLIKSIDLKDYECEEYIAGMVLHVDGIVADGHIELIVSSRYINNCLAFNSGVPLGSVFIDAAGLNTRIEAFTARILQTLALHDGAFHIELIHSETDELVFLELNARVGGAEITFLMRDLFDIDLVGAWVRLQVSGRSGLPDAFDPGIAGGWLLIPEPADIPCQVVQCSSLVGKIAHLYKELLPQAGDVFHGDGGYEKISGRFRFKAATSSEVEQAIYAVLSAFRIEVRSLGH